MKSNLLIVDDEQHTREGLELALEDKFEVFLASNPDEAFNVMESEELANHSEYASQDDIVRIVVTTIEEYARTYLPPSLLTLSPPPNGPDLLKSSTSIKDTLEIMHILIANIVAFPNNLNEIIQELDNTLLHALSLIHI